jgi:hypothetical protein
MALTLSITKPSGVVIPFAYLRLRNLDLRATLVGDLIVGVASAVIEVFSSVEARQQFPDPIADYAEIITIPIEEARKLFSGGTVDSIKSATYDYIKGLSAFSGSTDC